MGDFLSKIENFLFDILGLVLPGAIFLLALFLPTYFLDINTIPRSIIDESYILSGLTTVSKILSQKWSSNANVMIAVGLILSYLLGHVVKVFSIIMYEFLTVIFDKTINVVVVKIYEVIKTIILLIVDTIFNINFNETKFYKYLKTMFSPIKNTLNKVFTFKSSDYLSENNLMRTECITIVNQRLNTHYPDKWYSLYKISKIISMQDGIKSLANNFLAKYNLYRSLAFIFIFTIVYYQLFFNAIGIYIPNELLKISELILQVLFVLWFTFHYKFKRYWTLCGNETLVSLYYYLNKNKLNATG